MPSVRIQGVVRLADAVRRGLSNPASTTRRDELRQLVVNGIQQIEDILAKHGATIESLPAQTRRAYQFLRSLDLDSTTMLPDEDARAGPYRTVRFGGLASNWEAILSTLGLAEMNGETGICHARICLLSQAVEEPLQTGNILASELPDRTRGIRGWLALFSDRDNFNAYLMAVRRARPIIESSFLESGKYQAPTEVHFRPMSGLCRIRCDENGTRVVLPTPMITFGEDDFRALAAVAVRDDAAKQVVLKATADTAYIRLVDALQLLGGAENEAAGVHHDLATSFERVSRQQKFDGTIARPRLAWSIGTTTMLLSYYGRVRDTLIVSRRLDRPDTPGDVVDLVIHQELLRKSLGPGVRITQVLDPDE